MAFIEFVHECGSTISVLCTRTTWLAKLMIFNIIEVLHSLVNFETFMLVNISTFSPMVQGGFNSRMDRTLHSLYKLVGITE